MESILKKYGVHPPFHGKSMESIPHPMESIHQNYGIHPPFHGIHLEFLQSTPHSMDSIWINPGRVKYWLSYQFNMAILPKSTRAQQELQGDNKDLHNEVDNKCYN